MGKTERLKSRKLIEELFSEGQSFSNFPFRVIWMINENNENALQVGFTVPSRTFKKAVQRNRIKRLAREGWRLQKNKLQEALQKNRFYAGKQMSVFIIYTGNEIPEYDIVYNKMGTIIKKLLKLLNEEAAANT